MAAFKIIDVSYHNGTINWDAVKAAGIDGAIIRCGYGDNIISQDDTQWEGNADECTRLGIPFGTYIYSYAKFEVEVSHMNKLFYPALFHRAEEGGFWVSFPDFPECFTEGDDMTQTYEMAVEAMGLALVNRKEEGEKIPQPTEVDKISVGGGTLVIIEFDMLDYQRKLRRR